MRTLRLGANGWTIEMRPERGGRITSLRLDGEELLDQGIGVDQPTANGFVEGGAFGWDEMVPNIEPTDTLPDHGEAWRVPWQVWTTSNRTLGVECRGRVVPWNLSRKIILRHGVECYYVYTNVGAAPHQAYWCAHPLFKFERGMLIDVPGGEELANLAPGTSTKVFLPKGSIDTVRLRWQSGKEIELRWDAEKTPYVGVWVCNGDLGGYRQIAIEPATGGNDGPNDHEPAPVLAPGRSLDWDLQICRPDDWLIPTYTFLPDTGH